jgi:glycosyltransferase involved in cell wall biosynthesis
LPAEASSFRVVGEFRGEESEETKQVPCSATETAPLALMACVARLEIRDKGQDLLLEALADPVWRERDFQLDFFGSGPDREILEDLISFYGLGDKVRIVGFESDIRKIWDEHGLLVLPSLSEGTPISLIEAQLCGRASLVTHVDGTPDWVEEGMTGFLAEAATVHHLLLALERAWENRHRWREMGAAARVACLAKRDADPAGTLLALLREAAGAEN